MGSAGAEIKNLKELLKGKVDGEILEEKITRLTANGENYCSLMLKLDLAVQKNGNKNILHWVAKCLPLAEESRKMFGSTMITEVQWYSKIMSLFKEFQKENGYEEVADFFPEMVAARLSLDPAKTDDADEDSVLILENLLLEGYKNEDRYIGFNFEQAKAILKRLATFAAVFIGMKLKKSELFEQKIKPYLKEMPPPPGPSKTDGKNGKPKMDFNPSQYFLNVIEENPKTNGLLERIKPSLSKEFFAVEPHIQEPWATASHTDFWVNNIMVKNEPGQETKIKFVDFQVCRYRSFAADLIFFLLSSVQTDVQKEHFEELLRFYYDEFTKNLNHMNLDISLPYDEYLNELKTVAKNEELQHAIIFSTIIFGQKNPEYDHVADPDFNPGSHMMSMVKNMSQLQKDKVVVMALLADKMGWI